MDRQRRPLEFRQHNFEPAGLDRIGRLVGHHIREAAILFGVLDRGVGDVGGEARCAGHAKLAATPDEAPFRRAAKQDRVVRSDRLRRLWLTARLEIAGRCDHDPRHLADMARHQRGIGQMPDPDREIDTLLD